MAYLFRPTITRYVDAAGKPCRSDAPGAVKSTGKARKWYGRYRDAAGVSRSAPLSTNKTAARIMLSESEKAAKEGQAGINVGLAAAGRTPLKAHFEDFRKSLVARDRGRNHVTTTLGRLRNSADGCGWAWLRDVDADRLEGWLADQREAGNFGATTANGYLTAWKTFSRWAVRAGRLGVDPLAKARKVKAGDAAVERRAATDDEVAALLEAARAGEPFRGLSGEDRAVLYLTAVETGFRVGELSSLTTVSFGLNESPPTIHLAASAAKAGVAADQPIWPETAAVLKRWADGRVTAEASIRLTHSDTPLWPGTWREKAAEMVRRDLERARIWWLSEATTA